MPNDPAQPPGRPERPVNSQKPQWPARSAAAACSACLTPWHRLELTDRDLFILQHDALDHARVNTKS